MRRHVASPFKFSQYFNLGFSLGVSHHHQNLKKCFLWNISVCNEINKRTSLLEFNYWNLYDILTWVKNAPVSHWIERGLPPGHDWPPGICALWCSSTWTPSTWNNLWRCTPLGRRLGTELWRGALWSVHRNPVALCRWEACCLEPTCKYRSGRKEGGEVGLLNFK